MLGAIPGIATSCIPDGIGQASAGNEIHVIKLCLVPDTMQWSLHANQWQSSVAYPCNNVQIRWPHRGMTFRTNSAIWPPMASMRLYTTPLLVAIAHRIRFPVG